MEYGPYFQGKRVLVTGGAGFIGSNLARRLAGLGAYVTLVDSLIPEYGGNLANIEDLGEMVRLNIADVRDEHAMEYLVQGQDYLFNLAGQTSHLDSMTDPFTDLDINCRAQLAILEACRRANPSVRLVFASTRQIYGRPDYLPVDEKHLLRPTDVNGVNKMAGEWYHILYNNVYDIPACALRLTNTFGPGMRVKDARQTFVGIWIRLALEGKPFEVWGGEQLRDFTYVDDCVEAMLLCAVRDEARGQVYNLGGQPVVSLRELADMLAELSGAEYAIKEFPPERKRIDIGDYYSSFERIRDELGWEPRVDLKEGLSRTLDYYRERLDKYL
ncbi:NAD-dependent epimerase/dehydratase family protein [Desulfohalovibrio reitneri]|uniref:NAD-dependent epimerase/dehydratase family protein n=1 Tax=Desulfohalovibrio reitneri TaxID=1307759 RepID=UPI0004A6B481|nr:NAD-dependent epimerase/dehydratase family protein [Desulfohalovibrio reitneri]